MSIALEVAIATQLDADQVIEYPRFGALAIQSSHGKLRLDPKVTRHRGVLVTGRDFLPIQHQRVVLDVHTPSIYLGKKRTVKQDVTGGLVAELGERVRELPGESLLVGGSTNYYHWLVDHLPRILLAREVMGELPTILINTKPARFQLESLHLLGISHWEEIAENESVRCDTLWVPARLASTTVAHPAVPVLLREAFCSGPALPGNRKVYFSRRDAASRRLVNEAELIARLPPGFEVHVPGEMSFPDQVALCQQTSVLLAAHGAALANIAFLPANVARVVELHSAHHRVTSMMMLARAADIQHSFVAAKNVSFGAADGNPLLGDWESDVEATVKAASGPCHAGDM